MRSKLLADFECDLHSTKLNAGWEKIPNVSLLYRPLTDVDSLHTERLYSAAGVEKSLLILLKKPKMDFQKS